MEAARAIWHDRLRAARTPLLAALEVAVSRAMVIPGASAAVDLPGGGEPPALG